MQSDWSNTPDLDYVTNTVPANYYGASGKFYRETSLKPPFYSIGNQYLIREEVRVILAKGDTVKIGVDYYGSLGVSRRLIPPLVMQSIDYKNGEVGYFNVYVKNNLIYWGEMQ